MKSKLHNLILLGICILLAVIAPVQAAVIHVAIGGNDTNDGSSWTAAKLTVQAGVDTAASGDEIWVAAGTYNECITLKSGVKLLGGFAGTETAQEQRNWSTNETILDGANLNDSVITVPSGATSAIEINGFTIKNGKGKLLSGIRYGGGIYCVNVSPTIANNKIISNCTDGGIQYLGTNPGYDYSGGGIYCDGSSSMIINNIIAGNGHYWLDGTTYRYYGYGGGIYAAYGRPQIINNTVCRNITNDGSGIFCVYSMPKMLVANNVVAYNQGGVTTDTRGIYFVVGEYVGIGELYSATNNCTWPSNNNTPQNSWVTGEVHQDPLFAGDASLMTDFTSQISSMDFHIQLTSPCIDKGDDTVVQSTWLDCDGQLRQLDIPGLGNSGTKVDIGADELKRAVVTNVTSILPDGAYGAYNDIPVTVEFSEPVEAIDWPCIEMETGEYDSWSCYWYNDSPSKLVFDYLVGDGETSTDLEYKGVDAFKLDYGSIVDSNGIPAVLTLPTPGTLGSLSYNKNIIIDTTVPTTPVVMDDGTSTTSTTQLHATWTASDPESGVTEYQYAVGLTPTPPTSGFIVPWTSTGTVNSMTHTGLNLYGHWTYYIYVKAKNGTGVWSSVGCSDGITIDSDIVPMDFLIGIGEFEKSTYSRVAIFGTGITDEWGEMSTPDCSVADGWTCVLPPVNKYTVNLTQSPGYQYLALKNNTSGGAQMELYTAVSVDASGNDPNRPHPGDTIVFHIDKIRLLDFDSSFGPIFRFGFSNVPGQPTGMAATYNVPNSTLEQSGEVEVTIPAGTSLIKPSIYIGIWGNLGSYVPGVLLDGAHLYIKRYGESTYATEHVPVIHNRNINTCTYVWDWNNHGVRDLAITADEVSGNAWDYTKYAALRKLNPDIKIYLYQSVDEDYTNNALRWSLSPLSFEYVMQNHPEWLYVKDDTKQQTDPARYWHLSDYQNVFPTHVANTDYQEEWLEGIIAKTQALGVDGVYIDDCGAMTVAHNGIAREPYEVQQFLQYVVPRLREEGLIVRVNRAESSLDGTLNWQGEDDRVYCDPFWGENINPLPDGYALNSPDNTMDVMHRENAFVLNNNRYNKVYWLRCLNDADIIAVWNNTSGIGDYKKRIHYAYAMNCLPLQNGANPYGPDGWINFGLCSYLLCQNEWTSFVASSFTSNGTADFVYTYYYPQNEPPIQVGVYEITKELGTPDGNDQPIGGNDYFRYRNYVADSNGGYGGVVVVNADDPNTHYYTLPFNAYRHDDTSKATISSGTSVPIEPNTARIFIRQ
ncbi:MAG: putative glycoside hydrolase [Armatimonadota bacterium]|nr:putative glycoside hydrolase [bacterium]